MKKTLLLFFSFTLLFVTAQAQTFADDFESYNVGDYLGASSEAWTTWSGNVGNAEDVRITDENANSGSNAIKFASNSPNGGPQDVVLFYGGQKLTTGFLNTKMQMYVETGAYFNYQAELQIGATWAMNAFFDPGGVGRITSSGNAPILQFNYPENQWFEFEMDINFDANKWQLKVNGVCVGSFASSDNSIASIDIFPINGHSFLIDDFEYTYSEESPEIVEDVRASVMASRDNGIAGNLIGINGSITNNGATTVNSFEADVMIGENLVPVMYDGLNLEKGDSYEFNIEPAFELPAGYTNVEMNMKSVNDGTFMDEDICNDVATAILFGVHPEDHKKVVVEEATGTWCGFCPRGTVWMDRMQNRYPEHFIGIAVHNDDPMAHDQYDSDLSAPGYPNALVNRGDFIDPSGIEGPILDAVTIPSAAILENGALWDEDTRELTISLDVTALDGITPNYRVNVVLTEDGVTGTTSGYGQRNYFSGSSDLIDDNGVNWKDLPPTVPAEDMVYEHVARAILAPFTGMQNSFDAMLDLQGHKAFNFSYTVPEDFDIENMHIITFLINPNGTINTGESTTIEEAVENGFTLVSSTHSVALDNATSVYPNPMNEYTTVDINLVERTDVQIQIVDLSGRTAMQKTYEGRNGFFRTHVDTSNLPTGNYLMKIQAGNKYTAKKISVVH